MRRTNWKHTAIAFATLLTLVGTAPAMAAPATKQAAPTKLAKSATTSAKANAGSLAFSQMASHLGKPNEAAPNEAKPARPSLANRLVIRPAKAIAAAPGKVVNKIATKVFAPLFRMSTESKQAVADSHALRKEGRFVEAAQALRSAGEPTSLIGRFKMWNAARKLRNGAASAAKSLVKSGEFEQGLEALRVAETMTGDSRYSQGKTRRDVNRVYKKAMAVAEKASRNKTDANSLELAQQALEAAQQTGAPKIDTAKMQAIVDRAEGNHVQTIVATAERALKSGDAEYAANLTAQAHDLVENRGMKQPGYFGRRALDGMLKKMGPQATAHYEQIKLERDYAEKGMVYRSVDTYGREGAKVDYHGAASQMAAHAEHANAPIVTLVEGKEIVAKPGDKVEDIESALAAASGGRAAETMTQAKARIDAMAKKPGLTGAALTARLKKSMKETYGDREMNIETHAVRTLEHPGEIKAFVHAWAKRDAYALTNLETVGQHGWFAKGTAEHWKAAMESAALANAGKDAPAAEAAAE